jgi:hypothetical protein
MRCDVHANDHRTSGYSGNGYGEDIEDEEWKPIGIGYGQWYLALLERV